MFYVRHVALAWGVQTGGPVFFLAKKHEDVQSPHIYFHHNAHGSLGSARRVEESFVRRLPLL